MAFCTPGPPKAVYKNSSESVLSSQAAHAKLTNQTHSRNEERIILNARDPKKPQPSNDASNGHNRANTWSTPGKRVRSRKKGRDDDGENVMILFHRS